MDITTKKITREKSPIIKLDKEKRKLIVNLLTQFKKKMNLQNHL